MAKRTRLSEAHQFFEGQDAETQNADTDTTSERVCIVKKSVYSQLIQAGCKLTE